MDTMLKIGLVGRTNVGKSTLFNRLLGTFRAIVTDIAGTTRELLHEEGSVKDIPVTFVDSPGLASFEEEIKFLQQIIVEADLILFVWDGKAGVTAQEQKIADLIFSAGKKDKTFLVVNKLDQKVNSDAGNMLLADRYQLWLSEVYAVSAKQYEGVEELRDRLYDRIDALYTGIKTTGQVETMGKKSKKLLAEDFWKFESRRHDEDEENESKTGSAKTDENPFATQLPLVIVGRPNVGKSTLLNTLVGDEIAQVSSIAGTTLDYIKAPIEFRGRTIMPYDTAGIRKKWKIHSLEKVAYEKTQSLLSFIKPIVVMVIDAIEGVTQRDKSLLGELLEAGMPIIIAANKIDTFPREKQDTIIKRLKANIPVVWVPFVGISAEKWFAVPQLLEQVTKVADLAHKRISTAKLNKFLQDAWLLSPPRFPKNKTCKRKYITQVDVMPPTFVLSVNNEEYANFAFRNRCENVIRKHFSFQGVPIRLLFRWKSAQNPFSTGSYVGSSEKIEE